MKAALSFLRVVPLLLVALAAACTSPITNVAQGNPASRAIGPSGGAETANEIAVGDRLRIAGTAELNGYDRHLNQVRCEAIVRRVEQLFPGAGDVKNASFWTGLRPATPSNVPLIGRSRLSNLFLNTGHGTLGWTHACGSGKSVARIVAGLRPEVDFAFMGR